MIKKVYAYFLLRIAQWYIERENFSLGIEKLEKITRIVPEYHYAYFHLAYNLLKINELNKAKNYLIKAIEYAPKNPVYHIFLGIVAYEEGAYKEAKETLQKAIKMDSSNRLSQNYLALCFLAEGQIAEFKKIIEEKGIFENADFQIKFILALERHLKNKKLKTDSGTN